MQYSQAIEYLYSRLPVFHRMGAKAIKEGLGNTLVFCEALGNPHQQFQSIHVAGTNGKGSTSHMLAAIYQMAGYRVGLYTSPHLKSFTERIRINGQPIAEEDVARFVSSYQSLIERIEPSFFEATVVMAFEYFARQSVDIAIIEVGLGGRLDSTNVITPVASVITNIGYDHTDVLGDTLAQIATEKAGIIKPDVPVIIGETQPEIETIFRDIAVLNNAPIYWADQQYFAENLGSDAGLRQIRVTRKEEGGVSESLALDLQGEYQLRNVSTVLTTVTLLQPIYPVLAEDIRNALKQVSRLTGLKGRFQVLQESPRIIVDTAHNQAGLIALFETLRSYTYATLRIIIGMVADKDRTKALEALPVSAVYYFCQANSPRSLPGSVLRNEAAQLGRIGEVYDDVNSALSSAISDASPEDLLLVTGSNYTIAELIDLY